MNTATRQQRARQAAGLHAIQRGPAAAAVAALFGIGSLGGAGIVQAQSTPDAAPEKAAQIVVTGSQIRGVTPTGSPVLRLGAKQIEEGGYFSATDVLRSLPQILNLGATDSQTITSASQSATNQTGANGINLRGLGASSTLTLISSHRAAPGGALGQTFDASTVPSLAIERIEVLVDGTSALYGSDAVAGVVNIRLRKRFDGAKTQFSLGSTNDVRQWSVSQLLGKTWEGGGLTATFEHTSRNHLLATARPEAYNSDPYAYGINPLTNSAIFNANPANIRVTAGTYGGVVCSAAAPCFFAVPAGQNGSNLTGAQLPATPGAVSNTYAGVNRRDLYTDFTLLPRQSRDTLVLVGEQELSSSVRLNAELLATDREFLRYAPSATANLAIPNSNPYSPCNLSKTNRPGYCGPLATSAITVPYYFGGELGPQINQGHSRNTTGSVGLNVDLWRDWQAEFGGTYSVNHDNRLILNSQNTNAANADSWTRANGSFVNSFNPFVGDGSFNAGNQALVDKVRAYNDVDIKFVMKEVSARFDGPLMALPGGDLKMAAGLSHRSDGFTRVQRATNSQGAVNATSEETIAPPPGTRKVDSAYAEFFVPLVGKKQAIPGVYKLDLSLAGRYENNSLYGASRTPKVGLTWGVTEDFQFNGTFGRSFRAPSLAESDSYQGTPSAYSGLSVLVPNALNFNGQSLASTQNVLFVGGGNPTMKPEEAKTWTLGFNWRPKAMPGLELTVGYYDIAYTDRITTTAVYGNRTDVLSNPIFSSLILAGSATQAPTAAQIAQWLGYVSANTIGLNGGPAPATNTVVAIVDNRLANSGVTKTQGVDLSARYAWNSGIGRFDTGLSVAFVNSWKVAITPTAPLVEMVNTNSDAVPLKLRARAQLGWSNGFYGLTGFVNHANAYTNTNNVGAGAGQLPANERVGANTTVDLNASYDFGASGPGLLSNFRMQLNIQNLLDRKPPYARFLTGSFTTFDPQNASAVGRQISLQVSKGW